MDLEISNPSPLLSKTDYISYLQCPKKLWLSKNRKDLKPAVDETQQAIFDQGFIVEKYAHKLALFKDPTQTAEVKDWYQKGQAETKNYIKDGYKTIFQANAMTNDLYCKADILHYNDQTNKWDLYEVKSSTEVKDEHLPDLCFQKIAFEMDGTPIDRTLLIHINNEYVRNGEIDSEKLLTIEDLTEQVENLRQITETNIPKALEIIKPANTEEVQIRIGKQCDNPFKCPFKDYCWANLPDYSIFDLQRITEKQLTALQNLNIQKIADIPDDFDLNEKQQNQVTATKTGEDMIDKESIKTTLEALEYPLYFLDYETFGSAIPLFDGLRPYQQMCFQYSLHIIRDKGAEPEHYEYLHTGTDMPVPHLLADMQKNIGDSGSVIVWHKSFEMGRNQEMALMYPEYAPFLNSVNHRVFDLKEIFSNQHYVSAGFKGSSSIKKVLPILAPHLSYDDLEDIHEGETTSLYWYKHIYSNSPLKDRMTKNMLEYCKLDTLAMVEIWRMLGGEV
ncbi:DUF2779 domain-containing protein [Candidatus Peregrinibacteria bacterium]|nr:DUF2779 domain-containing protein [Candidatus Peregrinibacteria bacterium]